MEKSANSDLLISLLLRANKHRLASRYRDALRMYMQAASDVARPEILAQVADCHFTLAFRSEGNASEGYVQAVLWMERTVALAPQVGHWHAKLAEYLYLGLLECERSAQEYRTAIALGAKDESTFRGAAMLYGLPEDVVTLEEAIEWLEAAAEIAPEDSNIWGRLGQICHEAGRESEALAYWSKALLCPHPLEQGYLSVIERATGISSST